MKLDFFICTIIRHNIICVVRIFEICKASFELCKTHFTEIQ